MGRDITEQLLVAITQISIIFRKTTAHRRWPQLCTLTQTPASLSKATEGAHPHCPDISSSLPPAPSRSHSCLAGLLVFLLRGCCSSARRRSSSERKFVGWLLSYLCLDGGCVFGCEMKSGVWARVGGGGRLHRRLPRSCTRSKIVHTQQDIRSVVSGVDPADRKYTDRSASRIIGVL